MWTTRQDGTRIVFDEPTPMMDVSPDALFGPLAQALEVPDPSTTLAEVEERLRALGCDVNWTTIPR